MKEKRDERATGGTSARNNSEKGCARRDSTFLSLCGNWLFHPRVCRERQVQLTPAPRACVGGGAIDTRVCVARAPDERCSRVAAHRRPFAPPCMCVRPGSSGRRCVWDRCVGEGNKSLLQLEHGADEERHSIKYRGAGGQFTITCHALARRKVIDMRSSGRSSLAMP